MVFAAVVASVLFLLYTVSVEPLLNKQKLLRMQIKQQQNQISGIDNEIAAMAQGFRGRSGCGHARKAEGGAA
jgi:MSHA biogenesis protein MshJ